MTVFDVLAKRNADKLQAVSSLDTKKRFELRLDEGGVGIMDTFDLFEGVTIVFNNIPQGCVSWNDIEPNELQFDWCQRGRFELRTASGKYIYLSQGELAIHNETVHKQVMHYPMPLYTGFSLRINKQCAETLFPKIDPLKNISIEKLDNRLTGKDGCSIFIPDLLMKSLLESFWNIDEREALNRLRLKAIDLLILLSGTPRLELRVNRYQQNKTFEALQRSSRFLESDLGSQVLLKDAAAIANMSVSVFKERFSQTFGITPMAYRRQCRIEQAAILLKNTDDSISQIATTVGYRNPSKFTAAFTAVYGVSPSAYRASL